MTIFSKNFNIDLAARVWDLYMIEGIKSIYQAGISILMIFNDKLKKGDFDTCILVLKGKELFEIDQELLISHMKKTKFTDSILFDIQKLDDEYIPVYTSPN
jgi:protein associated with RNAse G/E